MSRTFNAKQKQALLKDSGGYCRLCGVPLLAGWHADHIIPYSKGGETDVINGQALCPVCNLKKGNKMIQEEAKSKAKKRKVGNVLLRGWQDTALDDITHRYGEGQQCCLTHATPGGGKTIHALSVFWDLRERGICDKLVIIAPSVNLVSQWMSEAVSNGINIELKNGMLYRDRSDFEEYDGIILTYQSVVNYAEDLRNFCNRNKTLVIADEAHHVAEKRSWGEKFKLAFELSKHILMLTGTPWTSTQTPMPFVTYGENGLVEADTGYSKVDAIRDGVCRITEFYKYNPEILVTDTTTGLQTEYENIGAATKDGIGRAYSDSTKSPNQMFNMFKDADRRLGELRAQTVRTAGGLIVAPDIQTAYEFQDRIYSETGVTYTVVSSDDPASHKKLKDFKKSSERWIISVNMITEGVDIKRLQVCLFLGLAKTELFLRQVVGRIERVRVGENLGKIDLTGYFYYLNHPAITEIIRAIEDDNKRGLIILEDEEGKCEQCGNMPCTCPKEPCPLCGQRPCICDGPLVPRYIVEQAEHEIEEMIARGFVYDDDVMKEAIFVRSQSTYYGSFNLVDMCNIVRAQKQIKSDVTVGGDETIVNDDAPEKLTLEERKSNLRKVMSDEVRRKVGTAGLLKLTPKESVAKLFRGINYNLNKRVGIKSIEDDISLEQLQRRLDYIYATEATSWMQ